MTLWVVPHHGNTPAKFDGHRHRGIGDVMVLVCHVVSLDNVTEGSSKIMGRNHSRLIITILASLVAIGILVVVCHVIFT